MKFLKIWICGLFLVFNGNVSYGTTDVMPLSELAEIQSENPKFIIENSGIRCAALFGLLYKHFSSNGRGDDPLVKELFSHFNQMLELAMADEMLKRGDQFELESSNAMASINIANEMYIDRARVARLKFGDLFKDGLIENDFAYCNLFIKALRVAR